MKTFVIEKNQICSTYFTVRAKNLNEAMHHAREEIYCFGEEDSGITISSESYETGTPSYRRCKELEEVDG